MGQFGMPTLIETKDMEDCASLCRELGLSFVELNMNLPQYQPDTIDVSRLRTIGEKYGIFYTIHLDENVNVSDFNSYIAEGYLRTVRETIALARRLSAPVINMHLSRGVYFTLPEKKVYLFSEYRQRYLESILAFRELCEKAIGDSGIQICIENCDGFLDFQKEAIELLLKSEAFALTFDIGHDHGCGNLDKPYILDHKDRLSHMHMHDASGKRNHQALGAGEIDLEACLALAESQACRIVLETKTVAGLRQSVTWLRKRGYI